MRYYIGNTDLDWYHNLKKINPEDINFWQPGGMTHFKAIETGSPFLLKLKSPINKVAGVGFFTSHSILPVDFAWEVFQERNGASDYLSFYSKIKSYRVGTNPMEVNPNIGCIVLTNPIFFNEIDWVPMPSNWSLNIVQGKTYSTDDEIGRRYWNQIELILSKYSDNQLANEVEEPSHHYGQYLTKVRIGQGAFRVLVTDAYLRRCAITGERTLPVLEAAHIKPYSSFGINTTNNGLLLRADLHKLFDSGYITITDKYNVEISKRIKEEFENGRDYYKYHGESLISIPQNHFDLPNADYLRWHNDNVFRS
ncbi:MAG: HNH endonuclease [Bacteroidales bacterium]|nr:HNH endonuclease [Bacteroidales bacterium]